MLFVKGPVFANVLLADEINRTPPKTQAALLEAMQEHQVTAAGELHRLEEPFFVLATQNPIEMEGTYPLPEAQLDRFMLNVVIDYLPREDEVAVVEATTAGKPQPIEALFTGEDVLAFHDVVRRVPIAKELINYAVRLASASRPHQEDSPEFVNDWVSWGAGTRASQYLVLGRQIPRPDRRPRPRDARRHSEARPTGPPAPRARQLPRRSGGDHGGAGDQPAVGERAEVMQTEVAMHRV